MRKRPLALFSFSILVLLFLLSSFKKESSSSFTQGYRDTTVFPSFVRAKDHQSKNTGSKTGLISLTTGLDNDYFLLDSSNRTGYLYVETNIDRFVNTAIKKVPLNISIVIDRSGSMTGEKM